MRYFVALGASESSPRARLEAALAAMDAEGIRLAGVSRPRWTPLEGAAGPDVLNAVAEVQSDLHPGELLQRLQEVETAAGRRRDGRSSRALDLDVLVGECGSVADPGLVLPHPRALERAFVLAPWAEIAPLAAVPGPDGGCRAVVSWLLALRARRPEAFEGHQAQSSLTLPPRRGAARLLSTAAELRAWRDACRGSVGWVPTMGALHAGHASLLLRAGAETDHVVCTIFINRLQFGPAEDFDRYPRPLEEDLSLCRRLGVEAVYVPSEDDLYATDFSTYVVPEPLGSDPEGALRPGHFRGVATVVLKLWMRVRPNRAYFSIKDAQQLAVVRRMTRDLDLPGTVVQCSTVRDSDGLPLSSRNQFLSAEERSRARALPRALQEAFDRAAAGEERAGVLESCVRERLAASGLVADYAELVDPDSFARRDALGRAPALLVAAARAGATRLLDNTWLVASGQARPEERSA